MKIVRGHVGLSCFNQIEQLRHQIVDAGGLLFGNLVKIGAKFFVIKFLRQHLDKGLDGRHRILDLMRQPCRQIAQKRKFFHPAQ